MSCIRRKVAFLPEVSGGQSVVESVSIQALQRNQGTYKSASW